MPVWYLILQTPGADQIDPLHYRLQFHAVELLMRTDCADRASLTFVQEVGLGHQVEGERVAREMDPFSRHVQE